MEKQEIAVEPNGAAKLYYDNTKTFETTAAGATVTGTLTATSFSGDGSNLTNITATADLVTDTSPQLGGNLDVNTKNILFGDSASASDDRLVVGAGGDLHVYHDGTDTYVSNATGDLRLFSVGGSADDVLIEHKMILNCNLIMVKLELKLLVTEQ